VAEEAARSAKVNAEIQAADRNLMKCMEFVMWGLQIHALDQGDPKNPWELDLVRLEFTTTALGEPEGIVGHGGFGIVLKANYVGPSGRPVEVAVKKPHVAGSVHSNDTLRKAWLREANILYSLRHRNVVEFVGAVDLDQRKNPCYMLVYELLPMTLKDHLRSLGPNDRGREGDLIGGMAEGLAYLHTMGIVHRDTKPDNVMIGTRDGRETPILIDFGLPKEIQKLRESSASPSMAFRV